MNVTLLRQASRDGLGVLRWIVGPAKVFVRPHSLMASDISPRWLVQIFHDGVYAWSGNFHSGRDAFRAARKAQ
jgi:hypothetical protein